MDSARGEIRDAEERLRAAMLANDVDALAALLHDQLVFQGPDGVSVGKEDDLAAHRARRLRLTALDLHEMEIDVDGSVARVTVRAVLSGTFDGHPCDGSYRYTRTWRKTGADWQIIGGGVTAEPSA
jgi:ketosteroid isomerase-like protein